MNTLNKEKEGFCKIWFFITGLVETQVKENSLKIKECPVPDWVSCLQYDSHHLGGIWGAWE